MGFGVPGRHQPYIKGPQRCHRRRGAFENQRLHFPLYPDDGGKEPTAAFTLASLTYHPQGLGIFCRHVGQFPPSALPQVRRATQTSVQRRFPRGLPFPSILPIAGLRFPRLPIARLHLANPVAWQIVSTDDYMPMQVNSPEEYEKVVNVSWFAQDQPADELR